MTQLRDEVEAVIRSWDAHERLRGGREVLDYDCAPTDQPVAAAASRLEVWQRLDELGRRAGDEPVVARTIGAHLAYLSHVLGHRPPLDEYLRATQGCPAAGWPEDHVEAVGERARAALDELGVAWGPRTTDDLAAIEQPLDVEQARAGVELEAAKVEPAVRALTGATAPYHVKIEIVEVDDYWSYWLDGAGSTARLRFNLRHARFTDARLRTFALHELLGHALQCASFAQTAARREVPWVRTFAVQTGYQVMLEGLATALPLFFTPKDSHVVARARLAHYLHLVNAELHRALEAGAGIRECVGHARARIPWATEAELGDTLADRGSDPLLRSYLWSYPAGTDWFVALADTAPPATVETVLRACYADPLTPDDLAALWPEGPAIGGPGAPVRLRTG